MGIDVATSQHIPFILFIYAKNRPQPRINIDKQDKQDASYGVDAETSQPIPLILFIYAKTSPQPRINIDKQDGQDRSWETTSPPANTSP